MILPMLCGVTGTLTKPLISNFYKFATSLNHTRHWFVDCISYSSNRSKSVTTLNCQLNNFPTRSHDFANALWHHRNIDKTLDIKSLQICHITQPHATLVCGLHLLFLKQVKVSHNPQLPTKQFSYSISWFCQCSVASQEHWQNLGYQIPTNLPHHSTTRDTGLWIASPILKTGQSQSQPSTAS